MALCLLPLELITVDETAEAVDRLIACGFAERVDDTYVSVTALGVLSRDVGDTRAGFSKWVRASGFGVDCDICTEDRRPTETGRLRLVDDGWPVRRAAERFQVSHTTAARWPRRYRLLGIAGMSDRSSRPRHQPRRTPAAVEEHALRLRREHRIGPLRLAARAGIAPSTAHRILARHGLPPLAALDRATGEPVRRYERARPGELVHIGVKKLGRIPDGGGHQALGRAEGRRNKTGSAWAYLHTALDDHTRLAYTEDLPDPPDAVRAVRGQDRRGPRPGRPRPPGGGGRCDR